eukprot:TRINITY_DN6573_c0_g3_i1.p1 TRINITY_DN6573_c0_g3~~TRINITY_DN6573_c0_g3_i1.p1  ORF type:complete len:138 (+),score=11.87 TRINITY_DN6573_c0_g3_i1:43-456(+)
MASVKLGSLTKEIIKEGDGQNFPVKGDSLQVHYTGRLISNGQKFDSSRDRGSPFQFVTGIGHVIKGFEEGISQMSLGEKAVLKFPSSMGYGSRGIGNLIPPHADLEFEVELLCINTQCANGPSTSNSTPTSAASTTT